MKLSRLNTVAVSAVLATVVTFAGLMLSRTTAFADFNLWTFDFLVNHDLGAHPMAPIVVVDFDDATFARLQAFPIPRREIASVVSLIASGHPRVIGLDLLTSEARNATEDDEFQRVLADAGNVVLGSQNGAGGLPPSLPLKLFCDPEAGSGASGFCKEGTSGALGYAFVNLPVDSDGFIRQILLFAPGTPPAISLAVMLAQQYTGDALRPAGPNAVSFAGHTMRYGSPERKTILLGCWGRSPVPAVSAIDLLDGKVDPKAAFEDKLVLVGQSNDAARDRHFTPVFRAGPINGVRTRLSGTEIHATGIAALLNGTTVRIASPAIVWIINFAVAMLLVWTILRMPVRYAVGVAGLLIVALYAVAQILFSTSHVWFQFLSTQAGVGLAIPAAYTYQFVSERLLKSEALADRQQMMGLFSRYVSPEVAQQIWNRRSEVILAGEERIATVLFSDIRSFTAMTAGKPPNEVLAWLNEYCTAMDEVIREYNGYLNKFIGDGLMVLYGVPLSQGVQADAEAAVRSALRMLQRVKEMNRLHDGDPAFPTLRIGIGVHTGALTSGNIGSAHRVEYSVIGETVNIASRLESLNKEFHTELIMSAATYEQVAGRIDGLRVLGDSPVRGIEGKLRLYTVSTGVADAVAMRGPQ